MKTNWEEILKDRLKLYGHRIGWSSPIRRIRHSPGKQSKRLSPMRNKPLCWNVRSQFSSV